MWTKIKKALALIGGGLIAVLFFILRIKKNKIEKIEGELNLLEEEFEALEHIHEKEEALGEISETVEQKTESKISEIKAETMGILAEEVQMEETGKRYNDIIGSWNNGE